MYAVDAVCKSGTLTSPSRAPWMPFAPGLVTHLHGHAAHDQLVVDRVGVADDEPHALAALHVQVRDRELRVVDRQRDRARPERDGSGSGRCERRHGQQHTGRRGARTETRHALALRRFIHSAAPRPASGTSTAVAPIGHVAPAGSAGSIGSAWTSSVGSAVGSGVGTAVGAAVGTGDGVARGGSPARSRDGAPP